MRRLVLVVVSLAALGIGVAAPSSSGPARAAVPRSALLPRLNSLRSLPDFALPQPQRALRALRAQTLGPTTCFVAASSCSIHPCAQFAGASNAVVVTSQTMFRAPTVIAVPRLSKPTCLPQAQRVNARVSSVTVAGAVAAPAVLTAVPKLSR